MQLPGRTTHDWSAPIYVFDVETDGLNPSLGARPFLYGLADCEGDITLVRPNDARGMDTIHNILSNPSVAVVGHNLKFDIKMAMTEGIQVNCQLHDTLIMAGLVNEYEPSMKLENLAKSKLGHSCKYQGLVTTWKEAARYRVRKSWGRDLLYQDMPKGLVEPYLTEDLELAMRLFWFYRPWIMSKHPELYYTETELIRVLAGMELRGIAVDQDYIAKMRMELGNSLRESHAKLCEAVDNPNFNPNAPQQVALGLVKVGVEITKYTDAGNPKTDAETLEEYDHSFCEELTHYRQDSKLLGTYFNSIMEKAPNGILHTSYWQSSSSGEQMIRTGRLSSSDPSMQNVPARRGTMVRRAFCARPGYELWFFDYRQIEMLLFVHFFKIEHLRAAVSDRGEDLHAFTAKEALQISDADWAKIKYAKKGEAVTVTMLGNQVTFPSAFSALRFLGKQLNFASVYGAGALKLMLTLNKWGPRDADGKLIHRFDLNEAKLLVRDYRKAFPEVPEAQRRAMAELHSKGYVEDDFGRRYHVPRALAYKALNAKIQGQAGNVMKRAMVRIAHRLKDFSCHGLIGQKPSRQRPGLVLTIHDEIVPEIPSLQVTQVVPEVVKCMYEPGFMIPLAVDANWTDGSWADKREVAAHPQGEYLNKAIAAAQK